MARLGLAVQLVVTLRELRAAAIKNCLILELDGASRRGIEVDKSVLTLLWRVHFAGWLCRATGGIDGDGWTGHRASFQSSSGIARSYSPNRKWQMANGQWLVASG